MELFARVVDGLQPYWGNIKQKKNKKTIGTKITVWVETRKNQENREKKNILQKIIIIILVISSIICFGNEASLFLSGFPLLHSFLPFVIVVSFFFTVKIFTCNCTYVCLAVNSNSWTGVECFDEKFDYHFLQRKEWRLHWYDFHADCGPHIPGRIKKWLFLIKIESTNCRIAKQILSSPLFSIIFLFSFLAGGGWEGGWSAGQTLWLQRSCQEKYYHMAERREKWKAKKMNFLIVVWPFCLQNGLNIELKFGQISQLDLILTIISINYLEIL